MLTEARTDVAKKRKPSERYENLTPMEGALLDLQQESNDRVVAAIEKLEAKAPSYRLVAATASSIILGVLALVVYLVSLIASANGVDPTNAANATKTVISATHSDGDGAGRAPGGVDAPEEAPAVIPTEPPSQEVSDG